MVELTESLKCLYTGTVERRGDEYVVRVPDSELEHGTVSEDETYRVVLLDHDTEDETTTDTKTSSDEQARQDGSGATMGPPVDEGEIREVTIETLGDQGDGIAKIERGYVVIVPDAELGDELTVEITTVRENVAFAEQTV